MSDSFEDGVGGGMSDGGDSDLEAELAAITSGGRPKPRPKPKPTVPAADLDRMVAASLRDIGSDEELSGDDDDPDLLSELTEITGGEVDAEPTPVADEEPSSAPSTDMVGLLKGRLEMYKVAEGNAKAAGDAGKARRFNRGLKTVQDLLKKAERGGTINMDDIPPEVSIKPIEKRTDPEEPSAAPLLPSRPAPVAPQPVSPTAAPTPTPPVPSSTPVEENPTLTMLRDRQKEYKLQALQLKKSGNNAGAIEFIKIAKMFEPVIKAVEDGQDVDLSDMPPPAHLYEPPTENPTPVVAEPEPPAPAREDAEVQNSTEEVVEENLVSASSVGEALQQRFEKYKSVEQAAKDEGNSSKARRFGRIVKQYEDAIKKHKAGKPIPLDELPCPPGFAPFPGQEAPTPVAAPTPAPAPVPAPRPTPPTPSLNNDDDTTAEKRPRPPLRKQDSRVSGNLHNTHIMNVQITQLKSRQEEFKKAAVAAKKSGDLEQAKEYLKIYKGFESLIGVAESGLPVDMNTLPIPPSQRSNLEDSFTFVNENECDETNPEGEIAARIEEQLKKQLTMCKTTRDHLRALGDVPGTNRFENLGLGVQKDLDLVRLAHKKNLPIPKFHYEMKNFNIVKCNTDLTDNQIDVEIIRGINYNVSNPKDVDTYVKVEFPWPQEEPYKDKTGTIKNTDNPEYNTNFVIDIQRSNRTCQRIFKRQAVKLDVYSKG